MYCAHEIASLTRAKLPASIASWILPTRQASHPCSSRARIKIDKISIELSFCRPGPACLRSTWSNNHLPEAYNALIKGLPMGYAIRICNQDMQSGYAIRICNQDMQSGYAILISHWQALTDLPIAYFRRVGTKHSVCCRHGYAMPVVC